MKTVLVLVCLVGLQCVSCLADEAVPNDPQPRWWRGNTHTHSLWSDGDDFPEMIAEWYRTHGYNFLALSDHNVLSQGQRWMPIARVESRGGDSVLPKYRARYGGDWVETRGEPGTDSHEVRLKPFDEFRSLVEERGKFIMIPSEEVSDRSQGGPVHMNATNLQEMIEPAGGATVREAMTNNLRAVDAQAKRLGREIMMHLNHPNFGYAVTAEDIASVVQERFFEVFNGHPAVGHLGDAEHPGVERLWDIANTIRIGQLNAAPLFGVATDDSHNYHGKPGGATTGRGWVMVRSNYLTAEHLIRAMKRGDFYASSGVTLNSIEIDDKARTLKLQIKAEDGQDFTTHFIGTRKNWDQATEPRGSERITRRYSDDVGAILSTVKGLAPMYQAKGDELYVRAVVTSSADQPDPPAAGMKMQAWTQPVMFGAGQ